MPNKLKLDWSSGIIIDEEYFPEDKLGRAKYAEFLSTFLSNQGFDETEVAGNQCKNYVLNLNAEWGAGKSYFLRRWANDLKRVYPVVYIDVWQQDYSEDPLMTVISSLIKQLREQAGKCEESQIFKTPRKLVGLLKAAAPGIARGLSKRYIGFDPATVMMSDDDGEIGQSVTDENGQKIDLGIAASAMVKQLIDEHDAKHSAIESLKTNVEQWIHAVIGLNAVRNEAKSLPAFVFIDELDRCRPSYAVEMLETIKHIFDIEGVVFVVATDTEQLQHTVKSVYGEGFSAREYLNRFFDSRFTLRAVGFNQLLEVHCSYEKLSDENLKSKKIDIWPPNQDAKDHIKNITEILNCFEVSTRTGIQITERIIATLQYLPEESQVDLLLLTSLLCIREKDESFYTEIITNNFKRQGDNGPITVFEVINEQFNIQDKPIYFYFNPQKVVEVFKISNMVTNNNTYCEKSYISNIEHYFTNVCVLSSNSNMRAQSLMFSRSDSNQLSSLEKLGKRLDTAARSNSNRPQTESSDSIWLEYLYIHKSLDALSLNFYQDLVELTSALDWEFDH